MECLTYRYYGHHVGDISRTYYRAKEEEQQWQSKRDPLKILAQKLLSHNLTDQTVLDQIQADVQAEIESGAQFALSAPFPQVDEVNQNIYA